MTILQMWQASLTDGKGRMKPGSKGKGRLQRWCALKMIQFNFLPLLGVCFYLLWFPFWVFITSFHVKLPPFTWCVPVLLLLYFTCLSLHWVLDALNWIEDSFDILKDIQAEWFFAPNAQNLGYYLLKKTFFKVY